MIYYVLHSFSSKLCLKLDSAGVILMEYGKVMAHTIQKPKESLEDQALPSTVLTSKSLSRISVGELTQTSSSIPQREAALHSKNGDFTTPTSISGTISSSSTETRRSAANETATENVNTSFQLSALGELPKQSDKFKLGSDFGGTPFDVLEHRDRFLSLESNSLSRDDGQGITDNRHLSKSRPAAEDVGTMQERIQILQLNCEHTMQQLFQKEEENLKLKNEVFASTK